MSHCNTRTVFKMFNDEANSLMLGAVIGPEGFGWRNSASQSTNKGIQFTVCSGRKLGWCFSLSSLQFSFSFSSFRIKNKQNIWIWAHSLSEPPRLFFHYAQAYTQTHTMSLSMLYICDLFSISLNLEHVAYVMLKGTVSTHRILFLALLRGLFICFTCVIVMCF